MVSSGSVGSLDAVIVGAGMSGLAAAVHLVEAGRSVVVVDKSRGVGGRMASRRTDTARFDHGAPRWSVTDADLATLIGRAEAAGVVGRWMIDGREYWRGQGAMTDLAKWMVREWELPIESGEEVVDVTVRAARSYVVTAPLPQSLAVLSFSRLLPEPLTQQRLSAVRYEPSLCVMFELDRPLEGVPGGWFEQSTGLVEVLVDHSGGEGASRAAVTARFGADASVAWWQRGTADIVEAARASIAGVLGSAEVVDHQLMRWRYAQVADPLPERCLVWGDDPVVALAGDAFGGSGVEGAYLSGVAAAAAVEGALR